MINTTLGYIASLLFISSLLVFISTNSKKNFFQYFPAIVLIYVVIVILSVFGLWDNSSLEIKQTKSSLQTIILPVMLFLMLVNCDIKLMFKIGKKILIAFFCGTISILIGFIIVYFLIGKYIGNDVWKNFAALSGSWIGGMGNMLAIKQSLNVSDVDFGYILVTDSINYTIWFALIFSFVAKAKVFDKWVKAKSLDYNSQIKFDKQTDISFNGMFLLVGIAFSASAISSYFAGFLPESTIISNTTWCILIVTALGLLAALTPISKIKGDDILANMFLYTLIAVIASGVDFTGLSKAPIYVLCGFMILMIHLIFMLIAAKIFKLNLAICSIASLANIGGIGGSTIIAGAYSKELVSVAVLICLFSFTIGTPCGLILAKILLAI